MPFNRVHQQQEALTVGLCNRAISGRPLSIMWMTELGAQWAAESLAKQIIFESCQRDSPLS